MSATQKILPQNSVSSSAARYAPRGAIAGRGATRLFEAAYQPGENVAI
jgi:hypothetical protein